MKFPHRVRRVRPPRTVKAFLRMGAIRGSALFLLIWMAGCGRSPETPPPSKNEKITNFESNRALYLALDVKTRAQEVSATHARQARTAEGAAASKSDPFELTAGYDSLCAPYTGLSDRPLRDAVFEETDGHYVLGYRRARDHMYGLAEPVIDIVDGVIEDAYTGRLVTPDGTRTPENTNTEHSWPQSKGTREGPAHSDIHHLFIIDAYSNSRRQNFEFGAPKCGESGQPKCRWVSENHGNDAQPSRIGLNAKGEPIFEVRTARRGDIARAQFYISVRYNMAIEEATEKVLRAWHAEDPPDAFERERNRRIELVQQNRNPFVDCPDIVDAIDRFAGSDPR